VFCGCGGNAIAFAKAKQTENDVSLVVCIDIDRQKLKMAANNASIYGIPPNKMVFIEADACSIMSQYYLNGDLVKKRSHESNTDISAELKGFSLVV